MKTIKIIVGALILASCTQITQLDAISSKTVDVDYTDDNEFCCKYQRQGQSVATCVTVNGDCDFCYELCKKYPVKDRNPIRK